jgi:hypothetical protein
MTMPLTRRETIDNTFASPPASAELCEFLEWDSGFFQRRIARVLRPPVDRESFEGIDRWCAQYDIECIYLLVPADRQPTVQLAERFGYNLVDVRVTLEQSLDKRRALPTGMKVSGPACPGIGHRRSQRTGGHQPP